MSMGVRKYATLQHHLFVTSSPRPGSQLTATGPATVEEEYVVASGRDAWAGNHPDPVENQAFGRPGGSAGESTQPPGLRRACASQTGGRCRGLRASTAPGTSHAPRAQGNAQPATRGTDPSP